MHKPLAVLLFLILVLPGSLAAQKSERQKVVDIYAKELKSRDASARAEAAYNLGRLEAPEAVPVLIAALSDRDPDVREAAASALWSSAEVAKDAIPALRTALQDPAPAVVMRAAGALISMDVEPDTLADPLRNVLQKGDAVDKFLAARALIGIEPGDKLADPIIDYLARNSPDPKNGSDWSALRDNFDAGEKALKELAATQDRKVVEPMMDRLRESQYLTKPILKALGVIKPKPERWVERLVALLTSPSAEIRDTALEMLEKETSAASVKQWAQPVSLLVKDKEKNVRDQAIRTLKAAGGLALGAISPVIQAVKSEQDPEVRGRAAEAVGEIGDSSFAVDAAVKTAAAKEALPILSAAIEKDPSIEVRGKAMRALDKLQLDPLTVADILARVAVEQKDRNLRLDALQLLNLREADAASVEARIAPLKNDPDELIRNVTKGAIESMHSDRSSRRSAAPTVTVDPAVRDKALETLREYQYKFTEEAYFSALNDVETDIVKAFLDAGMSPNHKFGGNNYGNPALRVVLEAEEGCNTEVRPTPADTKALVKLLLARGADPNIADDRGNTPLMEAVEGCDPEMVKILLAAKANMNAKNASGLTAFEFGLWNATDGAAALAAAGFRLSADKVKVYNEAYAKEPKKLALVKKATKTASK